MSNIGNLYRRRPQLYATIGVFALTTRHGAAYMTDNHRISSPASPGGIFRAADLKPFSQQSILDRSAIPRQVGIIGRVVLEIAAGERMSWV